MKFLSKFLKGKSSTRNPNTSRKLILENLEERTLFSAAPVENPEPENEDSPSTAQEQQTSAKNFADQEITQSVIEKLAKVARDRWAETGLSDEQQAALDSIEYRVEDLGPNRLAMAQGNVVSIDINAAGKGWFVDETPEQDEEFLQASDTSYSAIDGHLAGEGVDLLTVIMHEQGHVLGLNDTEFGSQHNLMFAHIDEGVRKVAAEGQAEGIAVLSLEGINFATQAQFFEGSQAWINGTGGLGVGTAVNGAGEITATTVWSGDGQDLTTDLAGGTDTEVFYFNVWDDSTLATGNPVEWTGAPSAGDRWDIRITIETIDHTDADSLRTDPGDQENQVKFDLGGPDHLEVHQDFDSADNPDAPVGDETNGSTSRGSYYTQTYRVEFNTHMDVDAEGLAVKYRSGNTTATPNTSSSSQPAFEQTSIQFFDESGTFFHDGSSGTLDAAVVGGNGAGTLEHRVYWDREQELNTLVNAATYADENASANSSDIQGNVETGVWLASDPRTGRDANTRTSGNADSNNQPVGANDGSDPNGNGIFDNQTVAAAAGSTLASSNTGVAAGTKLGGFVMTSTNEYLGGTTNNYTVSLVDILFDTSLIGDEQPALQLTKYVTNDGTESESPAADAESNSSAVSINENGGTATYTIKVDNVGGEAAHDIAIQDSLTALLANANVSFDASTVNVYVGSDLAAALAAGAVTVTGGVTDNSTNGGGIDITYGGGANGTTLAAGDSIYVTFDVAFAAGSAAGEDTNSTAAGSIANVAGDDVIPNEASVTFANENEGATRNSTTDPTLQLSNGANVSVAGTPDLTIVKEVQTADPVLTGDQDANSEVAGVAPDASLGETVTFTLTVSHTSGSSDDAFDINIQDLVPPGFTNVQLAAVDPVKRGATFATATALAAGTDYTDNSVGNNVDITVGSGGAVTVLLEDFNDSTVLYTTSVAEASDNDADYFGRVDSDGISIDTTGGDAHIYNGFSDGFFAAQDTDADPGAAETSITFSGLNIAGISDVEFSGLFAEDDAADGNEDYDNTSDLNFVIVEAQIDGGGYSTIFQISPSGATGTFNSEPAVTPISMV